MLSWYMGGVDFGLCIVNPSFEAFHTCDLRVLLRYPHVMITKWLTRSCIAGGRQKFNCHLNDMGDHQGLER